jgi:hypothetical protein
VTRWLGFLELATLAALGFGALAVCACAALWPLLRPRLRRWHPQRAARVALLMASAPAWAPALGLALCLAPGVLGGVGLGEDHCPHHGGHAHLCLHHPAVAQGGAAAALLGTAAIGSGLALLRGAGRLARARRSLAVLHQHASARLAGDARLLASAAPVSLSVGVLRPRVVVSQGLVDALPPAGLACVLAHERAHVRRRDALRALLASALSWPHPPRVRRALLDELRLASERACDEAAAAQAGDRLLVAETILAVEKLARRRAAGEAALACAFGESDVATRVEALLGDPVPVPRRSLAWAVAAALAALGLAAADPLHHATEHLLRTLLALL